LSYEVRKPLGLRQSKRQLILCFSLLEFITQQNKIYQRVN